MRCWGIIRKRFFSEKNIGIQTVQQHQTTNPETIEHTKLQIPLCLTDDMKHSIGPVAMPSHTNLLNEMACENIWCVKI